MTKSLRLQTEYMGTRRTSLNLHGALMDINEDNVGTFFAMYWQREELARMKCKAYVSSRDFALQVILDKTNFQDILDMY